MRRRSNTNDLYFVTMTVVGWVDIFSRKLYKDFIAKNLIVCQEKLDLDLYKYVIMSNHIHLIAQMRNDSTMSKFLGAFKSFTSKELFKIIYEEETESRKEWMSVVFRNAGIKDRDNNVFKIWQNGSFPTLLFTNEMIDQKAEYLENNPVRAGIVEYPEHYIYSSASPISPVKCLEF